MSDNYARLAGVVVDVSAGSVERATNLLAGISGGAYKAVGSALKRAADSGKTVAKRTVTKEYTISQSEFLARTRNINHFVRESSGEITVSFGYAGCVIPLTKFNTRVNGNGQVVTQVKRSSAAEVLEHSFQARMGEHRGIYERIGLNRFPVEERYGPATSQMIYSNDEVIDEISARVSETFDKRIDQDILALLNGWRR
jgi:hypothetical protein